jgi:murein L,D-transpeptidase YcbB/YkuD
MSIRLSALVVALCACAATPALSAPATAVGVSLQAGQPSVPLSADDAALLIQTLKGAEAQGFAPGEFDVGDAEAALRSPDPELQAKAQARLEAAAIAYARAQHGGRTAPGRFPSDWAIRPKPYDAAADFALARAGHQLASWAAGLAPADPRYAALVQAYGRYREIAAKGGWTALAAGPSLKPGATGDRVHALRTRLAIEDSAVPSSSGVAPDADVYDAALAAAVSRAQARYGLTPDGVLGGATLRALNLPVQARLGQMRANLERWRWAPRQLPAMRVELNIASATLALYDSGETALGMKAIVGQARKPTPMFEDRIEAVVFNPPWNVPQSIAIKEIWPKIRKDPGYMAREGFVVKPDGGLQQRPGPRCALGTIKFDLPNRFGVYLHDTPAHSLFARDQRNLSHGCMRLEQPNVLAKKLLDGVSGWPGWRVDAAIASGTTQRVVLPKPVPVFVFYWSAFVADDGQVNFRPDAYGWDAKLLSML